MMAVTSRPVASAMDVPTGWTVRATNVDFDGDNVDTIEVPAYVICASPWGRAEGGLRLGHRVRSEARLSRLW